jgi:fructan beta-fructosidase
MLYSIYQEPFRPQFHFSPERNWMNDPNGMVYHEGEYHLFYQYNPFGDKWGHMSWGHALSRDLVHWKHLPVALVEEGDLRIYSGSAVVDFANSSGFGTDRSPLVAIYTGHREETSTRPQVEDQRLAYSNDRGRSWTHYPGNPVLDIGLSDFRDPKVFWHKPTQRWVMAVVLPMAKKIGLYASVDLKRWSSLSEFGPAGAWQDPIIWECPDLFPLDVEGEPGVRKWVLIVNINPGGPAGGSGTQYFVGEFDGTRFICDQVDSGKAAIWLDHGSDFYAGVTWSNVPDGRRILLAWMSNWAYTLDVPTSPWRSAMTIPRSLSLRRTPAGLRLTQEPVEELATLREEPALVFSGGSFAAADLWLYQQSGLDELLDVEMTFSEVFPSTPFVINIHTGAAEVTAIAIDPKEDQLAIDRTHSGLKEFHPAFAASSRHVAPLRITNGILKIRFLLDTSSLEVFAQDGETVLTDLIFPSAGQRWISLSSEGGNALAIPKMEGITICKLRSAVRDE